MTNIKLPPEVRFDYGDGQLPKFWVWCEEMFGKAGCNNYYIDSYENILFMNDAHATLFILKWL